MPPDTHIVLRAIRAYGRHGADEDERAHAQPLDIDVELDVDAEAARRSDALRDTVDYAALHGRIRATVAACSFALLERLGQRILDDVMVDGRVRRARVTIAKPHHLHGATPSVSVTATRT